MRQIYVSNCTLLLWFQIYKCLVSNDILNKKKEKMAFVAIGYQFFSLSFFLMLFIHIIIIDFLNTRIMEFISLCVCVFGICWASFFLLNTKPSDFWKYFFFSLIFIIEKNCWKIWRNVWESVHDIVLEFGRRNAVCVGSTSLRPKDSGGERQKK